MKKSIVSDEGSPRLTDRHNEIMGYVRSYIRRTGVAVRDHFRKRRSLSRSSSVPPPPDSALQTISQNPIESEKVFAWVGERETISSFSYREKDLEGKPLPQAGYLTREAERWRTVGKNGIEEVHVEYPKNNVIYSTPLTPKTTFVDDIVFQDAIFVQKDLSESIFLADINGCNFSESRLDGSTIGQNLQSAAGNKIETIVAKTSFDNASLKNVVFSNVLLSNVSFVDADLTGTKFLNTKVGLGHKLDVTGSNITRQQINDLMNASSWVELIYKKYSFDEAIEKSGITEKQFEFLVLSGSVEVYDNFGSRVESNFDPNSHHLPQWEIQSLKNIK